MDPSHAALNKALLPSSVVLAVIAFTIFKTSGASSLVSSSDLQNPGVTALTITAGSPFTWGTVFAISIAI